MGTIKPSQPVKLIMAIFTNQSELFAQIEAKLEEKYGKIDFRGHIFDFDHTDYYDEEMGADLKKRFIAFKNLIKPEQLSSVKLFTNKLESKHAESGKRKINIDPGYVDNSKLVLASTKNYYHRIYLGKGIYAEVTLYYKNGAYQDLIWTYPDYRTFEYKEIFKKIRKLYRKQMGKE